MSNSNGVDAPDRAIRVGMIGVQQRPLTRLARTDPTVNRFPEDVCILNAKMLRTITRLNKMPKIIANAS
jgi:hypothetical protein